ncbi:MAG: right-handed parallel beta-helix repeat-containing protein [Cyclobacteriaceae bacterium]
MSYSHKAFSTPIKAFSFILLCSLFFQCSEEAILLTSVNDISNATTTGTTTAATTGDCGCTYTVPASAYRIDAQALGLKPGAVICLKAGVAYKQLVFKNVRGTATAPIIIKNCGGTAIINGGTQWFGIKTEYSSFFRITGGTVDGNYGIKITGGRQSLHLDLLTTNVEVDHVEISNSGFAGVMAKTEPSCDNATIRGNFVMRDVSLHHNYIHDTGAEAFYVGHNYYRSGISTPCGTRLPGVLEGVKIYNNIIKNSGWESIQVASTPKGAEVYNNRIENYGVKNVLYQNHGVQFGEGGIANFYGNFIKGGKGNGVMIIGNAENFVHNNVIVNTGGHGIFCDDRYATGLGFKFIHNTIVNSGLDGIRIYADNVPMNLVYNNVIVNPKSYATYKYPRTGNDAYVYLLGKSVKITQLNNYFTRDINAPKFKSPSAFNYGLNTGSPAINKGTNIAVYNISRDYAQNPRLKGTAYDIGAYEY